MVSSLPFSERNTSRGFFFLFFSCRRAQASRIRPPHPCFQQDSPHKKLLAEGAHHEGGEEDQEDLHGEWIRTSLSPEGR